MTYRELCSSAQRNRVSCFLSNARPALAKATRFIQFERYRELAA